MILDTNALSALADGHAGAASAASKARLIAIPVIVLGEYRFGIALSSRQRDYEKWLHENLPLCQVLEISEETTGFYADVRLELKRAGKPIPSNDLWIAALGRQHGLPILSRDRHFDSVCAVRRITW